MNNAAELGKYCMVHGIFFLMAKGNIQVCDLVIAEHWNGVLVVRKSWNLNVVVMCSLITKQQWVLTMAVCNAVSVTAVMCVWRLMCSMLSTELTSVLVGTAMFIAGQATR